MANNYLTFSVNLNVGSKENVATAFEFYAKLSDSMADSDDPLDFCMEDAGNGGLWFHSGDDSGAPDQVADFVRNLATGLKLTGQWGLTYAEYCDKPRVNEFNGGAIFLDFDSGLTSYVNSAQWLAEQHTPKPEHWSDHADHPPADWQHDVANGDTRLGYHDWVNAQIEATAGRPD